MSLRIVFMGTPDFAVPTLIEIVGRGHEIVAVYTRAAKPAGRRGLDLTPSPVEREARRFALPVLTPTTLRGADAEVIAHGHGADVAVIVAYGLILPKPILEAWPLGAFNLHASLLPRWRGAAPINRAIMAGGGEARGGGGEMGEGGVSRVGCDGVKEGEGPPRGGVGMGGPFPPPRRCDRRRSARPAGPPRC